MSAPYFIGIGAQKSGTSWIYACLYEHPEIYIPEKEIHFFSRDRNWRKGFEWYERKYVELSNRKCGEFSTSYLSTPIAAERIRARYPDVRLILILRHPVDRAFSNYLNCIRSGEIEKNISFQEAAKLRPEILDQGHYKKQIEQYLDLFPREQVLILIYEDIARNPSAVLRQIFDFLDVSRNFTPTYLNRKVNQARIPLHVGIDTAINRVADLLRKYGMGSLVWAVKKSNIPEMLRILNTKKKNNKHSLIPAVRKKLIRQFKPDIEYVERLLCRRLYDWSV